MSQWYEHRKSHGNHLYLYSERGWMSFLFWHVLADDLEFILDNAKKRDCSKDTGLSHHAALALCRILVV